MTPADRIASALADVSATRAAIHASRALAAEEDGTPPPPEPPEIPPGSLSAWAVLPDVVPCPFPALTARRRAIVDGWTEAAAWPIGLLPASALAADLVARGVRYRRGLGYSRHGAALDTHELAVLVADVLDDVAALVEGYGLPDTVTAHAHREKLHADHVGARVRAVRDTDDGTAPTDDLRAWIAMHDTTGPSRTAFGRPPAPPAADVALARERLAYVDALGCTAADVRTSSRARSAAVGLVRGHLPAPEPTDAPADHADAVAWLASRDHLERIPRADVPREYAADGSPGGLTAAEIRAAAAERWGPVSVVKGTRVHYPARALEARA